MIPHFYRILTETEKEYTQDSNRRRLAMPQPYKQKDFKPLVLKLFKGMNLVEIADVRCSPQDETVLDL